MTFASAATNQPKSGAAIGGGVLAGLLTLAVITGAVLLFDSFGGGEVDAAGGGDRVGAAVAAANIRSGDCVDFDVGAPSISSFDVVDCDTPHVAEVVARIEHPDAGGDYPGADALTEWLGAQCTTAAEDYLAVPVLDTTLIDGSLTPDINEWTAGNHNTICYVRSADGSSLTGTVAGRGENYGRGDLIPVERLKLGDCFQPSGGVGSYDLNSNSMVQLVDCDGAFNGIFFGRDLLADATTTPFPGAGEVGDRTSNQCSELFQRFFGVSSDGFNYRYWRPNEQSWQAGDRVILCAVLDETPQQVRFEPTEYQRFYDLAPGTCFNLGPEESADSLRLDDQVRRLACSEPHIGQMLGSGNLDNPATDPFPQDDGVQKLAGAECEVLFTDFVGISPFESDFGNFPFWYPNEAGWEGGDRRYACAVLEDSPRSDSLEDAGI